jgi:hypothetical protein
MSEHQQKVVKRIVQDALSIARETNNISLAHDLIFGEIQEMFVSYLRGFATKTEYNWFRLELEREMEKLF